MKAGFGLLMGIAVMGMMGIRAREIDFADLPRAAQITINRHLDGGAVQCVTREDTGTNAAYQVSIRRDGARTWLQVTADGMLARIGTGGPARSVTGHDAGGVGAPCR